LVLVELPESSLEERHVVWTGGDGSKRLSEFTPVLLRTPGSVWANAISGKTKRR